MEREEYAYKTPKSSQFLESMSEADMLCLLREWKADVVFRIDEAVGDFLCLVDLNMYMMTILGFSTEYMSPTKTRTELFLGETSGLYDWWGDPWCIRGDFNITKFQSESMGAIRGHSPTWESSNFILEHGFIDIPLQGGAFKYSNNNDPPSMLKIGRFF